MAGSHLAIHRAGFCRAARPAKAGRPRQARSGQLLERLEKAFTDEHGRLLQNDTVNFTAELNVLDKLLKMEGR